MEVDNGEVGKAGGEVVGTIAGGEVPMDREGAGAKDKDDVEAGRVAIVGEGANFG